MPAKPRHAKGPLQRALIATDFSANADLALKRAALLPFAPGAQVLLLHALPRELAPELKQRIRDAARARLEERAETFLAACAEARGPSPTVRTAIARNRPDRGIVQWAKAFRADLTVVGRHGRRRWRPSVLGTTADRVIRTGTSPVLVVARRRVDPYARPLAALGFDPASAGIAAMLVRIVPRTVRPLVAVHAFEVPFEGWLRTGMSEAHLAGFRQETAETAAKRLRNSLASTGASPTRWSLVVREGDPRDVVLREARRIRADLIAIGTRGRSGLARLLLGSVAEGVIRGTRCDVLVTPPAK